MTSTAVDLRGLEPPEPLLHILEALERPQPEPFVFLLAREPLPLYPLLRTAGWEHSVQVGEQGVELTVYRKAAIP